jgi:hypothetical protein
VSYEPKKLTLPRLGRRMIRKSGPYDCGATQLVENEGDSYYARALARSDAGEYVKRLKPKAK